jgi:DNA-binding protein HU-beta
VENAAIGDFEPKATRATRDSFGANGSAGVRNSSSCRVARLTRRDLPFIIRGLERNGGVSAASGAIVIKLDIVNEVVNKTGITKSKAETAVEAVFDTMKKALSRGDRIELRGFGVFNVRPRKTGIGRNPRTGAEVNIPPGKAVRFKPGKELQSLD